MTQLPVAWNEGMFLRPHHFQAADRFWSDQLGTSVAWTTPYSYGIRSIDFSREAIANSQFELTAAEARLADGTLVELGQELDRLDLKGAFADAETVRVCLAVPKLRPGIRNVSSGEEESGYRFEELSQEVPDANYGGNEQPVEFLKLRVRLCLSTDSLSGYEVLPIAQIRRAVSADGGPQLDADYAPPLLNLRCWPDLDRDVIRGTHDLIGQKIEVVSKQVRDRGITLGSSDPGDLERIFMLQVLNEADATLGAMTRSSMQHPYPMFVEMCRVVGMLSIFGKERRLPDLPVYDHDNLMFIFKQLREHVKLLLGTVTQYEYEQRYFTGAGQGMAVALEEKWLGEDWEWYVGVRSDHPNPRVQGLLQPGRLDWKIGSADQVDQLFRLKWPGLELQMAGQTPRALPPDGEWLYFQVKKLGGAWQRVFETRTLGMRFKRELIVNRESLEGQRMLNVASGDGTIGLEFALFAVPRHSGMKRQN
jgi:type VI secretion system protein ImpJ